MPTAPDQPKPGRKPGTPKTGGRKKGTPNKNKDAFREALDQAAASVTKPDGSKREGFDILAEYVELYDELRDTDKQKAADMVGKLMEYAYPKKRAVEVSGPDGGPVEVDYTDAASRFDRLMGAE